MRSIILCLFIFSLMPVSGYTTSSNNDNLYLNISRLNTRLNVHNCGKWKIRDFSWEEECAGSELGFADCFIDSKKTLNVVLYTEMVFIEREEYATVISQLILKLCQEYIDQNISLKNIKIIVKTCKVIEPENTLFIWDNGHIQYFPLYFDDTCMQGFSPHSINH